MANLIGLNKKRLTRSQRMLGVAALGLLGMFPLVVLPNVALAQTLVQTLAQVPDNLPEMPKPVKQNSLPANPTPAKADPVKTNKDPIRLEPFIKADAIAIGKWLVMQRIQFIAKQVSTSAALTAQADNPAAKPNATTPANRAATKPSTARTSANAAPRPQPNANRGRQSAAPAHQRPATPQITPQRMAAARQAPMPPAPSNHMTIDAALEMRVAVVRDVANLSVATSEGGALISLDGQLLQNFAPGTGYLAAYNPQGLTVNGANVPNAVWVQPDSGYVAVDNVWYRGRVLLILRENGVRAINYVMLQEYLYSVVGAEMSPSWPLEALKAQAIAARSYALVHNVRPASDDYDLDDTTRYQAYRGIVTEANTTHAAVQGTSGEFISHNGGIVESLYAATQDIVDDAHSGFGMSQTGALELAEQGMRYHEILALYYPQTAVGRLDVSE
jgi:stage II sporulation protein D